MSSFDGSIHNSDGEEGNSQQMPILTNKVDSSNAVTNILTNTEIYREQVVQQINGVPHIISPPSQFRHDEDRMPFINQTSKT